MKASDIPTKFPVAFASSAIGSDIRDIPETTADPNAASLDSGFPAPTFTPITGGGVPPDGRDFNGLFLQITQWTQWQNAGAQVGYDATFSTAIGGYPEGAILKSATVGNYWINLADDNTTDPDAGGANWAPLGPSTGDAKMTLKTTADYGWVMMNDGTIGNASSNATTLAAATAAALFALIWNNVSNSWAPLLTSAAAPVARGASAAADFAANRQITLTLQLGRAIGVAGAGSGLTSRALGEYLGEQTHQLTTAELASHIHGNVIRIGGGGSVGNAGGVTSGDTGSTGGDTPHNNMQPTAFWNVMIKL